MIAVQHLMASRRRHEQEAAVDFLAAVQDPAANSTAAVEIPGRCRFGLPSGNGSELTVPIHWSKPSKALEVWRESRGFAAKMVNQSDSSSSSLGFTTAMRYDIFGLFRSSMRSGLTLESAMTSSDSGLYGNIRLLTWPSLFLFNKIL
ncbi:hypothetical protein DM860_002195 [Cuscuta australis]|uniref:Uncharacterized protein n=1 Tax=Cuscuta australis TaxID=267555 RepID=A0A328DW03_9ASTE|nr:hypothetical protein DM860_002195 [Cuscuta australis]